MKRPALDEVRTWPLAKRQQVNVNARNKASPEAVALVALLQQAGLALGVEGPTLDHPVTLQMANTVHSDEGRAAAISAARRGVPAISGVDPILAGELGERYSKTDLGTATAGSIVAGLMREAGYTKGPDRPCEPGCVATTGATWIANEKET